MMPLPIEADLDGAGAYSDRIRRIPLLTAEQEKDLSRQMHLGGEVGKQAREQFVEANQRLVWSIAMRYQGHGLELMDLVQEGNIGLIHAVDKFDPGRGNKFSTLAVWWIKQAISRAIEDTGREIRIPAHRYVDLGRMKKAEARLFAERGRPPTDDEVAEATGLSVRQLVALRAVPQTISLSLAAGDDDDLELGDTLADPAEQLEEEVVETISSEEIRSLLEQTLSPRELLVVCKRFGFHGDERKLAQVGRELGISRERIRQIEARALIKLRHAPQIAALIRE